VGNRIAGLVVIHGAAFRCGPGGLWLVLDPRDPQMPALTSATPHLTFRQHYKAERMTLHLDWTAAVPHIPIPMRPSNENMAAMSPHSDSSSLTALPRCRNTSSLTVLVRSSAFTTRIETLNTGEGRSMRISTSSESANPTLGFNWSSLQPSNHAVTHNSVRSQAARLLDT
jgi:hypothetical protein